VIAALLFLFSYAIAILPVVLLFGAEGMESLFEVSSTFGISPAQSKWMMVWGIGLLGSMYAIFGGLKAVAISDTINGVGFLIAGLLIPVLALNMVGDGDILAGFNEVYTEENEKFDVTGNEPGSFLPFGVLFTGMIVNQIFFWCTNQSIIQRALGAKNLKEAQKGVLIAASFKLLGPIAIVLPGVIAYHMFKDTLTSDQYLQAYPMLVRTVLPTVFTGFFAAVMVGAVLSTFNSVLNSAATLFSESIYRSTINKDSSGRNQVRIGRIFSTVLAIAAMLVAPSIDTSGSLYIYLQQINATFFGPMLAVILCGMMTTFVNAKAAKISLLVGPVLFYLLNFVYGDMYQAFMMRLFGLSEPLHFLHTLFVVFIVTLLILFAFSFGRRNEVAAIGAAQGGAANVDLAPWRYARLTGGLISVATIVCYIALAQ
jgi:SSS family solute:Na+ symporter